jgi:hypothetical protein
VVVDWAQSERNPYSRPGVTELLRIRIPLLAIAFILLGIVGSAAARPAVETSSSLSPYDIWLADRAPRHAPLAAEADPLAARRPVSERPRAVIRDRPFVPFDAPSVESVGVEQVIVTTDALAVAFQAVADRDTYRGIPSFPTARHRGGSMRRRTMRQPPRNSGRAPDVG